MSPARLPRARGRSYSVPRRVQGSPWSARVLAARVRAPSSAHLLRPRAAQSGGRVAARTGGCDWIGGAGRVTSRAPVPAAEIGQPRRRWHSSGQRWLGELEPRQPPGRPGPANSHRDRPNAEPGRRYRCRHGALPRVGVRPPGLSFGPSCFRYAGAGRVPSRRQQRRDAPRRGPCAHGSASSRRARSGRLLVLPAGAGRAKFARLAGGGHGITERGLGWATPARARTRGKGWGAEAWGPRLLEGPE